MISRAKARALAKHEKGEAKRMHRMGLHKMAARETKNARELMKIAKRRR